MPPKKRPPQKEAAEEEVNFGSELVTLDLEAKATNKLELDKLINHLWSQNLICAEVERGKPATATTPWNDCTRWRCLCTKVEEGKKQSCNDAEKWYKRTKNWVHDSNVNKAVEQHFQNQHYGIWLDANPEIKEQCQKSKLRHLTVAGSIVNLRLPEYLLTNNTAETASEFGHLYEFGDSTTMSIKDAEDLHLQKRGTSWRSQREPYPA